LTAQVGTSLSRVAGIARSLGDLSAEVVFIGGAIVPLLQTHPVIPVVRATSDVDAVVASTGYARFEAVQKKLESRGFKRDLVDPKHVHRWRAPDGTPFDLVPAGAHLGGTANELDNLAIGTAVEAELEAGLIIRHASAPAFLGLKWAAFWDRGAQDPFSSHDLEDMLALVVSRDTLVTELADVPQELRDHVQHGFRWLIESEDYDDLVAAHLGNAQQFRKVAELLGERIRALLIL
jgi:predicted nucleotidyltransferase